MKRGRKPKPYLVKVTEGNRGHSTKAELRPGVEPPPSQFESPLPLAGIALSEWNRILSEAYWLRASEAYAIADRCLCVARLYEAELDIAQRGTVVRTRHGKVTNPNVRIARAYRLSIQRYDAELGLTPSSRSRQHEDAVGSAVAAPLAKTPRDRIEAALCG